MLDFTPVQARSVSIMELVASLTRTDLGQLTNEMIDTMRTLIDGATDADVVFVPHDPAAYDHAAATPAEISMVWTLAHVIVHTTATAEESAALAAELARGVRHRSGRSRREAPWHAVTTIAQCVQRLEESRRMRLASLEMWPDEPDLDNTYRFAEDGPPYIIDDAPEINAVARFVLGLLHDDNHLAQIALIASAGRGAPQ